MDNNFKNRLKNLSKKYKDSKIWGLQKVITFGKYRDCTIRDIIDIDLDYIKYLSNKNIMQLDGDAVDYLNDIAEKMKYDIFDFTNKFNDFTNFIK